MTSRALSLLALLLAACGASPAPPAPIPAAVEAPAAMVYPAGGRVFLLVGRAAVPMTGERVALDRGDTLLLALAPTPPRPWTLVGSTRPGRCLARTVAAGTLGVVSDDAVLGTLGSAEVLEVALDGCSPADLERAAWVGVPGARTDVAFSRPAVELTKGEPDGEHFDVASLPDTPAKVVSRGFGERPLCMPERLGVDITVAGKTLASYPGFLAGSIVRAGPSAYVVLHDLNGHYRLVRVADSSVAEVGAGGIFDPIDLQDCDG